MKGKKHAPDQVIAKLAEGERMLDEGKTAASFVVRLFRAALTGRQAGQLTTLSCGQPHIQADDLTS